MKDFNCINVTGHNHITSDMQALSFNYFHNMMLVPACNNNLT